MFLSRPQHHVISREIGHTIPPRAQRWRVNDGKPRYKTYEAALSALAKIPTSDPLMSFGWISGKYFK